MDMHGIDLNLLVAFDALMAERNVTRAGARIGRTQPAMSAALARLRALFHDELFVRSPTGLQPTPRALDLSVPLSDALAQIQRTLDFTQTFEPAASTATFTLALSDHPAFVLLPRLMRRIEAEAPGVVLHVRGFTDRQQAEELLESGAAHAAVGVPARWGASILSQPLYPERFVSVVREGHPLLAKKVTLKRFLTFPHLLVSPEGDRRGHVDEKLAELGLSRRLGISLPHMFAAPSIVASSNLIATLMKGVVEHSFHGFPLRVFEPPLALPITTFVLAWHRRNDAHPAQSWLRGIIAEIARANHAGHGLTRARAGSI
ncbi:LysR family transcriptional regulator [Pendulispora rubella]|uniref:LysR family transcriptional regulator n=1 Tax=Pendulispora rubella TaxID=2741070 RepID=A0ABZ2L3T3_9BACT